ncbi:MAG: hypothetical protein U0166_22620 [Acidobacteriota bacterium]
MHPELGEIEESDVAVEHAQHRVLAEGPRNDRHAKVDQPALAVGLVGGADAAVLGDAVLGDVEVGEHLETADDRRDVVA